MALLMEQRLPTRIKQLFEQVGALADELCPGTDGQEAQTPACGIYAVGGLPRDLLLGRPTWDVDIVVENDGIGFAREFVARHGGRVVSHKRFQTAIIAQPDGLKIDVATARAEQYKRPGALPDVETGDIKADLYRRDFTINSMALQLNPSHWGRLVDYFGGQRDLKLGVVRVLHDQSFEDDPTRILRAVRFEQRYGFGMDDKTERRLKHALAAGMLDQVSGERIRQELVLLLKEDNPLPAFLRLDELGALAAIHPDLRMDGRTQTLFRRARQTLSTRLESGLAQSIQAWVVYLLALVGPLSQPARTKLHQRLKFPKRAWSAVQQLDAEAPRAEALLGSPKNLKPSQVFAACRGLSGEVLLVLMARSEREVLRQHISEYLGRLSRTRARITGHDLAKLGIPKGPLYKEILERVLAAKLDGQVTSKSEELELARRVWEERKNP